MASLAADSGRTESSPKRKWLCVATPVIGRPSETFIERHVNAIAAGETVVLTRTGVEPRGTWTTPAPQFISSAGGNPRTRAGLDNLVEEAVTRWLQEQGVTVMLSEYLDYTLALLPLAQALQLPVVAHAHGYDVSAALRNREFALRYRELNQCRAIVTVTELSKQRLVDIGINPTLIQVIPCCPPLVVAVPGERELSPPRLLAVGRMVGKKNPIALLTAFKTVLSKYPEAELHYVGDGPLLAAVHQFIRVFDMEERVRLYGALPSSAVQKLYLECDLFVQHSSVDPVTGDEEGLPLSILEAMAYGLPVVTTRHAGIPEAIRDGESGFLVNEYDAGAMGARMTELIGNAELRRRFAEHAYEDHRRRFCWPNERAGLLTLLRDCC